MKLDNRIWILLTTLICGVLIAGGWFVGASPQLTAASAADTQRVGIEDQNVATRAQLDVLKAQNANIDALTSQLSVLQASIPQSVDGSAFIASISTMASTAGVTISSFSLGDPTDFVAAVAATTDGTAAATPAATPAAASSGFYVVPISLTVKGSNDGVLNFVSELQGGSRLVLIAAINHSVDEQSGDYTETIGGFVYVLNDTVVPAAADATTTDGAQG